MSLAVLMHGSWVGSLTFEKLGAAGELPGRWLGCAAGAGPRLALLRRTPQASSGSAMPVRAPTRPRSLRSVPRCGRRDAGLYFVARLFPGNSSITGQERALRKCLERHLQIAGNLRS